jgi:membrane protease YdiL (CAAX protease family)
MTDRAAATVGFVLAGVALAGALAGWPGGLALVGAALSGVALLSLGLRRYGRLDPGPADAVAAGGGLGAAGVAIGSLLGPAVGGGTAELGAGPAVTATGGLGVAVLAYADWRAVGAERLAGKTQRALLATAIGLAGLLAIVAWSVVIGGLYRSAIGDIAPATGAVLSSVALGLGTGTVAWLYLQRSKRGFDFVDLRRPDRRDAGYVVAGIVVLLGLNLGIGLVFQALGLPAARHTIFDIAQDTPNLLLVLIPLSYLLIGPGEELLYRNVVQKSLYGTFSRPAAVVVASAIFAAVHVPAYSSAGSTPLSILSTLLIVFALALVLGVTFERTRNVLVSAIIHGSFNAIAFAVTYVQLAG